MRDNHAEIAVELVTDGDELDAAQQQRERFDRNAAWLQGHVAEVYGRHRGQCICVAGGEVFVGHTAQEVVQAAAAAHPDDNGRFVQYIPKDKVPRVYAH